MLIQIIDGKTTAQAETLKEVKMLLSYTTTVPRKIKPRFKKTPCPKCGKKVKYMSYHDKVMHGEGRLLGAKYGEIAEK